MGGPRKYLVISLMALWWFLNTNLPKDRLNYEGYHTAEPFL